MILGFAFALTLATGTSAAPASIPNPGFEAWGDTPHVPYAWTAGSLGSVVRDDTRQRTGEASMQLGAFTGALRGNSRCFVVSPSTPYFLTYYYNTTDFRIDTVDGHVEWYTTANCTVAPVGELAASAPAIIDVTGTGFHLFQSSATSPAGAASAFVQVGQVCGSGWFNCVANFDDVALDTIPTAVTVSSLAAQRSKAGIDVTWRAPATAGTLGFNVWRSGSRTGAYTRLNRSLIPALGAAYRYRDETARPGRYFYKLQLVRLDGSRLWAGTVAVGAARP